MQLDSIPLPDDLEWPDEFGWSPVEQTQDRSITGAHIIQEQAKQYGRTLTLQSNGAAWVSRATVKALKALEAQAGLVMTLTLPDATQHSVMFNRAQGAGVEAEPVARLANPDDTWQYLITLRLITVEPPTP